MKFDPKSKKEIEDMILIPAGQYVIKIIKAFERNNSYSGESEINLTMNILNDNYTKPLFDSLSGKGTKIKKLRSFCEAAHLMDSYDSHQLTPEQCVGKILKANVKKRGEWTNPAGQTIEATNYIDSYSSHENISQESMKEDDLPF